MQFMSIRRLRRILLVYEEKEKEDKLCLYLKEKH